MRQMTHQTIEMVSSSLYMQRKHNVFGLLSFWYTRDMQNFLQVFFGRISKRSQKKVRRGRFCDANRQNHYQKYRSYARCVIVRRVEELSARHGFVYNRIAIRNQRTRWGSCSSLGNLNFHYGLIFLPIAVRDYVIMHELCHLRHLNHSAAFWALLAQYVPDYKKHRSYLRTISPVHIVHYDSVQSDRHATDLQE